MRSKLLVTALLILAAGSLLCGVQPASADGVGVYYRNDKIGIIFERDVSGPRCHGRPLPPPPRHHRFGPRGYVPRDPRPHRLGPRGYCPHDFGARGFRPRGPRGPRDPRGPRGPRGPRF